MFTSINASAGFPARELTVMTLLSIAALLLRQTAITLSNA
jgi:hypothetical protein